MLKSNKQQNNKKKKTKKPMSNKKKIIAIVSSIILLYLAIWGGTGAYRIYSLYDEMYDSAEEDEIMDVIHTEEIGEEAPEPEDEETLSRVQKIRRDMDAIYDQGRSEKDPNLLNVLLIGVDGPRADTIMLAQYNKETGKAAMLSIPRDTYVKIPERGYDKINHAHAFGGVNRQRASVENFLDIHIDHYARIDMQSFSRVIDVLGGVEVHVSSDIIDNRDGSVFKSQGTHNLNGSQALDYVRFRSDNRGDFGRIDRQQQVMMAIMDELTKASNVTRYLQLMEEISPYVRTDITPGVVTSNWRAFNSLSSSNVQRETLSGDNLMINGIYYLEVDMEQAREKAKNLTY
ncbi:LCP family protein [Proteinivorax hydrogeniformans]|uniref:LCP family protein n=1 Tax=Proteinivorax hydrogeniformans TaxID=1826727 RepID=A0AAU8HWV3_9FIRM